MTAYRFVDAEKANTPVRFLCRVLQISRAAYYAWRAGSAPAQTGEDEVLLVHIRAIHRQSRGTYGSPRVTAELRAQGHHVGRRRVARLMREAGISGTPKRKFRGTTTDSDHDHQVAPNRLDREFEVARPNHAWVADITYIPTAAGWAYLAVIVDLFSRKVVGWSLQDHMRTELCQEALRRALATRTLVPGLVHHSDRGSQYASRAYRHALGAAGIIQSMSRKGNCWDNAPAESFFGTLEQELVGREDWADTNHARERIADYIDSFYNLTRLHSTLGYQSPAQVEREYRQAIPQAA